MDKSQDYFPFWWKIVWFIARITIYDSLITKCNMIECCVNVNIVNYSLEVTGTSVNETVCVCQFVAAIMPLC